MQMRMQMKNGIPGTIIKKRGLRLHLLALFLILIYIPISLNMLIVYNKTADIIKMEKLNEIKTGMSKTTLSINSVFTDLQRTVREVSAHFGLRKAVQDFETINVILQDRMNEYYAREFGNLAEKPYIEEVFCVSKDGKPYFMREKISSDIVGFLKTPLFEDFSNSERNELWYYGDIPTIEGNDKNQKVLFVSNKLKGLGFEDGRAVETKENIGYIFMILNSDLVRMVSSESPVGSADAQGLYDLHFNPLSKDILMDIPSDVMSELRNNPNNVIQKELKINNKAIVITAQKVEVVGWHFVTMTSAGELARPIKDALRNSFWLIGLVGIIASIWIVIEILIMTRLITDKEMSEYRLVISEEVNQKFRIYKHDWMNHLQIIQGLIQIGEPQKALQYTNKLTEEGKNISSKYVIGIPEVESAIFSAVASAQGKGIEVKLDCMKLPDHLKIKTFDLVKILVNLLKNAIYALEHADAVEKILEIRIYEELGEYIFEVINNVPVIAKELRRSIFEKGYTTKGGDGDGLGLYIVKRLAEKNMGNIELRVDERGNRFILRIPN